MKKLLRNRFVFTGCFCVLCGVFVWCGSALFEKYNQRLVDNKMLKTSETMMYLGRELGYLIHFKGLDLSEQPVVARGQSVESWGAHILKHYPDLNPKEFVDSDMFTDAWGNPLFLLFDSDSDGVIRLDGRDFFAEFIIISHGDNLIDEGGGGDDLRYQLGRQGARLNGVLLKQQKKGASRQDKPDVSALEEMETN
jgi:hypothetical protein